MAAIRRSGGNGRRSTCVVHNGTLYTSGIATVDLEASTGDQARDVFGQLDRLMALHGTDKRSILYATIYLRDMRDYGEFNAVWDEWIVDGHEPARSVAEAALALEGYRVKVALVVAIP